MSVRQIQYFTYPDEFQLESGERLPELTVAYHTYGEQRTDNVVWVCHALTANSQVDDWWPHTVEAGRFLDPAEHFTVCANILGSHYGTTGPLSTNPATGEPYYGDFPVVTVRDMARVHLLLADHLGIARVKAILGSSIGGFQAQEMALLRPGFAERLVLIATSPRATPWMIALNESQRMAIHTDATFGERHAEAGRKGMAAARSIGLLSYRGWTAYDKTQPNETNATAPYRAATYQQYQGEKLCRRFNAYSYVRICDAFDSHDIGRGRGGVEQALLGFGCPTLIVGISTDILFPLSNQITFCEQTPGAEFREIESPFGHDGFLVEHETLNQTIQPFLTNKA